jgi:adenosine deaminase
MENNRLKKLCYEIPKAELHIHIEGTFEPELIFEIAQRNNVKLPYTSIEELREKYSFTNLQSFLDIYYLACSVLLHEQDFTDLMYAYLKKANSQGLIYAEIFFDPQSHTSRGISFETVINGLKKGIELASKDFGVEAKLIMCFLRHLPEKDCFETYEQALPFKTDILAIGLDSSEVGHPPSKFTNVFQKARDDGFIITAHAGEEGDISYILEALDVIKVSRIDHGYNIINSEELMKRVALEKIPLTMCPLSNKKLKVCPDLSNYPLRTILKHNVIAMINSDDPAYFGGYIGDNYYELAQAINLTEDEIILLARNSFRATFLSTELKESYLQKIDRYLKDNL